MATSTSQHRILFIVVLFCVCGIIQTSLVKLVSKCTTVSGVGRCTNLPSSCLDIGGTIDDEIMMRDGTKAVDACADDEVCCLIPPIPIEESCRVCGKKGGDRSLRKSTQERTLTSEQTPINRLRFLRSVAQGNSDSWSYNTGRTARIMNGVNSQKNEWCWQVALLNVDGTVLGSGSLIDGRYVLTAAHKVIGRNSSNLIVLLGQHDFSNPITTGDTNSTVWYAKPQEIIIHERYNPETMDNNVALIRIPLVSCNTANICPVCLNDVNDSVDFMSGMSTCYITGWGASNTQKTSPVLQEARVRVLRQEDCKQRFAAVGLADLYLPYSAFCAEGIISVPPNATARDKIPIISTCSGDGGGPLVCEFGDGKWRLMGLIAMGLDECKMVRVSAPTVFVNVGLYRDWIDNIRKQRSTVMSPAPLQNYVANYANIVLHEVTDKSRREPKIAPPSLVEAAQSAAQPSLNSQIKTVFGRSL